MLGEQSFERSPGQMPAIDAEWYGRFKEAGGAKTAYEYLEDTAVHRNAERQRFEAGEIDNPTLDYPHLDLPNLEKKDRAFSQLKEDIIATDVGSDKKMETVKDVYHWRLNEKLAEVRLLKATASGDMNRVRRYSQFLYGHPSPEVFSFTVNSLRKKIQPYLQSDQTALRNAAADLDQALPSNLPPAAAYPLPDQTTFASVRGETLKELGSLINLPESPGDLDASAIKQAFDNAIAQAQLVGWKSVIDLNRASISVSQEKKTAFVPESRSVTSSDLSGLVLHEIGTHALRRKNGERSKLLLLGLGLDRYRDDEGVAGLREQVGKNSIEDFVGLEKHLAVSLGAGLDGQKRDFRGVYEIMQKHYLVQELAAGKEETAARQAAAEQAWDRCVRTFRGTDCKTPGVTLNKDLVYREANIDVWEVVHQNPNEIMRFSVGKYDPANPRHIMILDQLGVTDEDLAELEK